jgi:hypothetical protein
MKIYLAILALLLASCGPAAKLRRAERLIAKAELQGAHWRSDTVWKTTDHFIPVVKRDTMILNTPGDTITITKERLQVKIRIRRDSIYVAGACLPDTIRIRVPVSVTKTIEAKQGLPWWYWLIVALCFIGGTWMGVKLNRQ